MSAPLVLIMAGGTGGHVYPALAVAAELRARGAIVEWLGTRAGLESKVVPGAGISLHLVSVGGLRGKGLLRLLAAPPMLVRALAECLRLLARLRPAVVLGMGGFAAGPGGVAAWMLRRPLVVHEQNAIPGFTNRILARLATRVLEAFAGSFPPGSGAEHTGNPVRAEIAALATSNRHRSAHGEQSRLLVLGGSQGARSLNVAVPAAIARLTSPPAVLHQSGRTHLQDTLAAYRAHGLEARVEPFLDDMADAYAWADLVLCRAGAMTVAELATAGVASILVPFPHAVDDHQSHNARLLVDAGAAVMLADGELEPAMLAAVLAGLLADADGLRFMAGRARECALPDAAARVATRCLEVARV